MENLGFCVLSSLFVILINFSLESNLILASVVSFSSPSPLHSFQKSNINKVENSAQNPLVDQLTAMLFHVENKKLCGNNLQKLNIDLEPLWKKKFKHQITKSIRLANLANNLLATSSNHDSKLIDSDFLTSLGHFMLSKPEASDDTNEENDENKGNDPYLSGYGLVLIDPATEKCLFISHKNDNKTNQDDLYSIDSSCSKFNYRQEETLSSDSSNQQYILNNWPNDVDLHHNCFNWFKDFQILYAQYRKLYSDALNYQSFLKKLLANKNFSSKVFCGPFYECTSPSSSSSANNNNNNWVLIYALPLFDYDKNLKGSVLIKLKLSNIDINQCSNGDPIFAGSHKCKQNSECVFTPMKSFKSGNYQCRCKKGFKNNNDLNNNINLITFEGAAVEQQYWLMKNQKNNSYFKFFNCLPCSGLDCCRLEANIIESSLMSPISNVNNKNNKNNNDDLFLNTKDEFYSLQTSLFWSCRKYNMSLRYIIFFAQIFFVLITLSLALVVFFSRNKKVLYSLNFLHILVSKLLQTLKIIKHSMWVLLEIILSGTVLLYSTVIAFFFSFIKMVLNYFLNLTKLKLKASNSTL